MFAINGIGIGISIRISILIPELANGF